jgi:hypothetical protein
VGICDNYSPYFCTMINISILALQHAVLASIADTRYLFTMVNDFLKQAGKPAVFNVQLVSLWKEVKLNDGLFVLYPDVLLDKAAQPHLIIIPAMTGDMIRATYLNREYVT